MSDHLVELPAPAMNKSAFQRRREHLLAELERPASHRRQVVAAALVAAVLAVLAFAPISGASLGHRLLSGIGDWWSTAPTTTNPGEAQSFTDDWNTFPAGTRNLNGRPLPADARDLLSGLGPASDTITAFPTSNGAVCYMIEGAGDCTNLHTWPWNTVGFTVGIFATRNGGTRVFGITDAKVTAINLEIAGVEHPAILGNHAFYYHLPPGVHSSDLQQLTATWSDGSTHTMPLDKHWNPPHG
jgi:hypothetical protein